MTGRVKGKVAFVTGAARGQGRAHAVRLAAEGADIIAIDLCAPIDTVPYALASEADLKETARQVEAFGRKIVASQADVRDYSGLEAAASQGVTKLGRLDIAVANAGILSAAPTDALPEQSWVLPAPCRSSSGSPSSPVSTCRALSWRPPPSRASRRAIP
jgi:(+)-trans-carveol dehydrogenase